MTDDGLPPEGHIVTLQGKLNPAIFQPHWLASLGIIDPSEAEEAKPPLVSPEYTIVRTPRLSVQVTSDRLLVRNRNDELDAGELCALVVRLFEELRHTPISSVEMVHQRHVAATRTRWSDLTARLLADDANDRILPGGSVSSIQFDRSDDDGAEVVVVIQPSIQVADGVYFRVRRTYEVEDPEGVGSATRATELLRAHWSASLDEAAGILAALQ